MHPEIGFNTNNTITYLKTQILSKNCQNLVKMSVIKGSLIVEVNPNNQVNDLVLGFRSDIDALKIKELNDVHYRSTNNYMHACGHDVHCSILLCTLLYLLDHPHLVKNKLVFVFQAAEEGPGNGGAYFLINNPIIKNIDYFFNVHVNSCLEPGVIYLKDNKLYSSGMTFKIKIFGKSAHVANYHEGIDALKIGINVLYKINNIRATKIGPNEKAIVMVNKFKSGNATNVISDLCIMEGTIRYFDSYSLKAIIKEINNILDSEKINYQLSFNNGYPAVINDSALFNFACTLLKHSKIKYQIIDETFYLTDDFGRYNQNSKCFYYLLGTKNKYPTVLHSANFDVDETTMYEGFLFNLLIIKNINKFFKSSSSTKDVF